jgi:hypothetical protein
MVNTIILGVSHCTPLDISNSRFAHLPTLFFLAPIYFCINLEHLCLAFMFYVCIFLIKRPPNVGMLNEYEWGTRVKIKLSLEEKENKNSNTSSAYGSMFHVLWLNGNLLVPYLVQSLICALMVNYELLCSLINM